MTEDFRNVVDTMADGVLVCDADGRILYANAQLEQLSGYSNQQLLDQTIEGLVPAALRSSHEEHREGYIGSPRPRSMGRELDIRMRRRDGSELPVDIALSPLGSGDRSRVVAVVRDLTDEHAAAQRLRDQAQLLELAHDSVLVRRFEDGTITYWNQGAVEMYGYTRKQATGRRSNRLLQTSFPVSPEDAERILLESGRWDGELTHTRRDGQQVIVSSRQVLMRDAAGRPAAIFEIDRDITAERRARQHLEAVLEVTRMIISGAPGEAVLEIIVSRARDLVGAAFAAMALRVQDSLVVRAASGPGAETVQGMQLPPRRSLSGRVLTTRRAARVANLSAEPDVHPPFALAIGAGPALFVPVFGGESVTGTITLANPKGGREFTTQDLQVVEQLFGATAAVAVEYASAREMLRQVAQLEDRERIARDLHDSAIQTLFAVGMSIQSTALITRDEAVAQRLTQNVAQLDKVIRELRRYIFDLRPNLPGPDGVVGMLDGLLAEFTADGEVTTRVQIDGSTAGALLPRADDLRMIVVEALSNVRRHAGARNLDFELGRHNGSAVLVIADDGKGFAPDGRRSRGHGLRNLHERAARMGGTIRIDSAPGSGTRLEISLPL